MTQFSRTKLLVALAGVAVWAWGLRSGDERLRWAGIALLVLAFLLRLLNRRFGEPTRRR